MKQSMAMTDKPVGTIKAVRDPLASQVPFAHMEIQCTKAQTTRVNRGMIHILDNAKAVAKQANTLARIYCSFTASSLTTIDALAARLFTRVQLGLRKCMKVTLRRPYQLTSDHSRHHGTLHHNFFYCLVCLVRFTTQEQRQHHRAQRNCSRKCVTEGCDNYGQNFREHGIVCRHARLGRRNSGYQVWRYLFRLADIQPPPFSALVESMSGPAGEPETPSRSSFSSPTQADPSSSPTFNPPAINTTGNHIPLPPSEPSTPQQNPHPSDRQPWPPIPSSQQSSVLSSSSAVGNSQLEEIIRDLTGLSKLMCNQIRSQNDQRLRLIRDWYPASMDLTVERSHFDVPGLEFPRRRLMSLRAVAEQLWRYLEDPNIVPFSDLREMVQSILGIDLILPQVVVATHALRSSEQVPATGFGAGPAGWPSHDEMHNLHTEHVPHYSSSRAVDPQPLPLQQVDPGSPGDLDPIFGTTSQSPPHSGFSEASLPQAPQFYPSIVSDYNDNGRLFCRLRSRPTPYSTVHS